MEVFSKLPKKAQEHLKSSSFDNEFNQEFLYKLGVRRVELDNALQGVALTSSKMKASLYYPYVYVSTTRKCKINSCDSLKKRKFYGIYPCGKECEKYLVKLNHKLMPREIILKGNTMFVFNDNLPESLSKIGIDRLVKIINPIV